MNRAWTLPRAFHSTPGEDRSADAELPGLDIVERVERGLRRQRRDERRGGKDGYTENESAHVCGVLRRVRYNTPVTRDLTPGQAVWYPPDSSGDMAPLSVSRARTSTRWSYWWWYASMTEEGRAL